MLCEKQHALFISESDYKKILPLAEQQVLTAAELLENELGRAEILPDENFPSDVVAMDSEVTFVDRDSCEKTTVTLVFPQHANVDKMKISILSPVGSALIGLGIGHCIDWPLGGGKVRRLEVVAVSQAEKQVK
ncbi:MAG TPA: nucleoside diphosphate kinase regulator [Cellvibrio sp.]|nr:nucleoside diphosphate kinase regulator [Cellvibrio sp.]